MKKMQQKRPDKEAEEVFKLSLFILFSFRDVDERGHPNKMFRFPSPCLLWWWVGRSGKAWLESQLETCSFLLSNV